MIRLSSLYRGVVVVSIGRSVNVDSPGRAELSSRTRGGGIPVGAPVFISYSRADQAPTDWRMRLELYLAQARRTGSLDAWDDQRIEVGRDWRQAINQALGEAYAAVLLVGPGFLTSPFIREHELPPLLSRSRSRGLRIFPLIVGWCDYEHSTWSSFRHSTTSRSRSRVSACLTRTRFSTNSASRSRRWSRGAPNCPDRLLTDHTSSSR